MKHTGVYVFGTPEAAFFSILLPNGTCGAFIMPSAQDVFWLGAGTYTTEGGKLRFKDQNAGTAKKPDPKAVKGESFTDATFTPGEEFSQQYIQHGVNGDVNFILITKDTKFWEGLKGWKKLGEPRKMQPEKDFDAMHEIKKVCVEVINKYGEVFVWA